MGKNPITIQLLISIPYGSIKSGAMNNAHRYFCISIPYGSIKRYEANISTSRLSKFQFLMVQLKAGVLGQVGSSITNFNSLWFN